MKRGIVNGTRVVVMPTPFLVAGIPSFIAKEGSLPILFGESPRTSLTFVASVARILTELKDQIEHCRSREAFHAEQEVFHRQQRELNAADLQVALDRFAAFETAADAAGELVARAREAKKEKERVAVDDSIPAGKTVLSKLVARVVFGKDMEETFGATDVTREIQARYGPRLKRRIDVRTVAAKLRRMARGRQIHRVREGRSFHESLYRRGPGG